MEGLIKAIPDSYVEGMTASGTPDEVKKAGTAVSRRRRKNPAPTARGSASNPAPVRSIYPVIVQGSPFKFRVPSLHLSYKLGILTLNFELGTLN